MLHPSCIQRFHRFLLWLCAFRRPNGCLVRLLWLCGGWLFVSHVAYAHIHGGVEYLSSPSILLDSTLARSTASRVSVPSLSSSSSSSSSSSASSVFWLLASVLPLCPSFSSFWAATISALTVTVVTEFGDRTFFIAAILSLKYPKLLVLTATCCALFLMTIVSAGVGRVLHCLPAFTQGFRAVDDYAAAVLLLVFACLHFYSASRVPNTTDQSQLLPPAQEHDCDDGRDHIRSSSSSSSPDTPSLSPQAVQESSGKDYTDSVSSETRRAQSQGPPPLQRRDEVHVGEHEDDDNLRSFSPPCTCEGCESGRQPLYERTDTTATMTNIDQQITEPNSTLPVTPSTSSTSSTHHSCCYRRSCCAWNDGLFLLPSEEQVRHDARLLSSEPPRGTPHANSEEFEHAKETVTRMQYMRLGLRPRTWAILKETFFVVLVAELGDKSMVSTVALAASQNPYGVVLGAIFAHFGVTLCAIACGAMLQHCINERIANCIAGIVFLAFGSLTAVEAVSRQAESTATKHAAQVTTDWILWSATLWQTQLSPALRHLQSTLVKEIALWG